MLTQKKLLSLQKQVEIIAKNAGEYALSHWSGVEALQKGDSGDIVTEIDKAIEEKIKNELEGKIDQASFIGEEHGGQNQDGYVWVIDPIDGTKHYAHHMPSFYVQICLLFNNEPVLGVIFDPSVNHMFSSSLGNGSELNGLKIEAPKEPIIENSVIDIDFGGKELLDWKINAFRNLAEASYRTRVSAGRFAVYLLTGGIHAFVVVNPTTKIWDQAPRIILFREAGFDVEQFDVDGHKVILASKGELFLKIKEIIMNTVV